MVVELEGIFTKTRRILRAYPEICRGGDGPSYKQREKRGGQRTESAIADINMSCRCLTKCYNFIMSLVFTFRMDRKKRRKLRQKAQSLGKTESQFIREILDRELEERPLGGLLQYVKGRLALPTKVGADDWRRTIKKRNWRK